MDAHPEFDEPAFGEIDTGIRDAAGEAAPFFHQVSEIVADFHDKPFFGGEGERLNGRGGDIAIAHVVADSLGFIFIFQDNVKQRAVFIRRFQNSRVRRWSLSRNATRFPVVFERRDSGGFLRAFHAIDERDTDRVRVVMRIGCLAAEVNRERHVPDVNERQRVEQPSDVKGSAETGVDVERLQAIWNAVDIGYLCGPLPRVQNVTR